MITLLWKSGVNLDSGVARGDGRGPRMQSTVRLQMQHRRACMNCAVLESRQVGAGH